MSAHKKRIRRRLIASLTTALIATLSVAVPLLDGGETSPEPVLESEHSSSCPVAHNHTICIQFGASSSERVPKSDHRVPRSEVRLVSVAIPALPQSHGLDTPLLPRAPPPA